MRKATSRIAWLAFFFACVNVGLIGRVLYFKVAKGDEFEKKVTLRTAGSEYEIEPLRGNIVDRNGKNVVVSAIVYDVILDPSVLLRNKESEQNRTLDTLSKELQMSKQELEAIVKNFPESKYKVIKKEVPEEIEKKLIGEKLKGVWLQETFVRKYPKETLMSQTIGFFNKTGQGQYGVEQQYDDDMLCRSEERRVGKECRSRWSPYH